MLELIGLVVVIIVVSFIIECVSSDDVDFEITGKNGKKIFEYHKHDNQENDKNNEK